VSVHFNFFLVGQTSDSVECFAAGFGEPSVFDKIVIVSGINESEFALGKWYWPGLAAGELTDCRRIEIVAAINKGDHPPSANEVCFLFACKGRAVGAEHIDRKKAVVTTMWNCRLYIVDCRFHIISPRFHRFTQIKN